MHRRTNIMKAGGVKLQGLEFYVETKIKEDQNDPEIEKQIFIPYINRGIVQVRENIIYCINITYSYPNINWT